MTLIFQCVQMVPTEKSAIVSVLESVIIPVTRRQENVIDVPWVLQADPVIGLAPVYVDPWAVI